MDSYLLTSSASSETPIIKKWIDLLLYKDELVDAISDSYKACVEYYKRNKPNTRLEDDLDFETETQASHQIDWVRRRELEEAVDYLKQIGSENQGRTRNLLRQLETLMTVDGKIIDSTDWKKFSNDFTNRRKIHDNIKCLTVNNLIHLLIELEKIKKGGFEDTFKYNHLYK